MSVPVLSGEFNSSLKLPVAQVAFGRFTFSGVLAPYSFEGIGRPRSAILRPTCPIVARVGDYRGALAALPPAMVIVMTMIAATLEEEDEALFVIAAGEHVTGACCLSIGRFSSPTPHTSFRTRSPENSRPCRRWERIQGGW